MTISTSAQSRSDDDDACLSCMVAMETDKLLRRKCSTADNRIPQVKCPLVELESANDKCLSPVILDRIVFFSVH